MLAHDVDRLRRELVQDARADPVGVYEAWWSANTLWPERPLSERLRLAQDAVASALDDGLIVIEVGSPNDGSTPVDDAEGRRLLNEWATWAIPEGPRVFMWRTEKGIAYVTRSSR
jgi:hypothetical protein